MYRTMIEGRRMNALVGKEGHSGILGVALYCIERIACVADAVQ